VGIERDKLIVIIAGPNGAGKTTFAREFLAREAQGLDFLNADEIAAELCPEEPESVAVKAGRIMVEQVAERIANGESFAVETTLSGRAYAKAIPEWQSLGYTVFLVFLRLPSAEKAVERVANRIRQGGHSIPVEAIRRRFVSGWRNFEEIYQPLVDCWAVYDSFKEPPRLIEEGLNE
jgi:predicted ABC-type ATPase